MRPRREGSALARLKRPRRRRRRASAPSQSRLPALNRQASEVRRRRSSASTVPSPRRPRPYPVLDFRQLESRCPAPRISAARSKFVLGGKARRPALAQAVDLASGKPSQLRKFCDGDQPRIGQRLVGGIDRCRRGISIFLVRQESIDLKAASQVDGARWPVDAGTRGRPPEMHSASPE